jgi:uncharacterized coiled-coil DUF342 family protein
MAIPTVAPKMLKSKNFMDAVSEFKAKFDNEKKKINEARAKIKSVIGPALIKQAKEAHKQLDKALQDLRDLGTALDGYIEELEAQADDFEESLEALKDNSLCN